MVYPGGNGKMNEFAAAMGICNLRHIEETIASRALAARYYDDRLRGVEGIRLCSRQPGVEPNYAYYPVYFDETVFGKSRDDVIAELAAYDIFARKYFYPAINEMKCYYDENAMETPVAHDASMRILTLPLYEGLSIEQIDLICDVILGIG